MKVTLPLVVAVLAIGGCAGASPDDPRPAGPSLARLVEEANTGSVASDRALGRAWYDAARVGGDSVDRAFRLLTDSWAGYQLLDVDGLANEFEALSKGVERDERSRLAEMLVQYTAREEKRGRAIVGAESEMRSRLRSDGILGRSQ